MLLRRSSTLNLLRSLRLEHTVDVQPGRIPASVVPPSLLELVVVRSGWQLFWSVWRLLQISRDYPRNDSAV